MNQNFWARHSMGEIPMGMRKRKEDENRGQFFISNLNGRKVLHLQPLFRKIPKSFDYEICGSDGLILEGQNLIKKSSPNQLCTISFDCKVGQTYFCKIIGHYSDTDKQEFRLFYLVRDDFNNEVSDEESESDEKITKKEDVFPIKVESDPDVTDVEEVGDSEIEDEDEDGELSDGNLKIVREYLGGSGLNISHDDSN